METPLPRTKARVPHLDISQEKDGEEIDRQTDKVGTTQGESKDRQQEKEISPPPW